MANETDFQADQWREEGPWLLLLLLPLCAFVFRRGYLLLLLCLTLPVPQHSYALDWNRFWLRPDQQASRALSLGEHEMAADLFENSEWKAAAQYLAGKYQESLITLEGMDTPRANYNRGNSLARLGRLNEAVEAYEKVLAQTPDDQDAKHNLELVKELLEKQKSQQQQTGEQENSQQQNEESKQGEQASEQSDEEQSSPQAPTPEENQTAKNESEEADSSALSNEIADESQVENVKEEEQPPDEQRNAENSIEQIDEKRTEQALADEHWLRRIPDDPGGLLRRKFRYQYQRKYKGAAETQQW